METEVSVDSVLPLSPLDGQLAKRPCAAVHGTTLVTSQASTEAHSRPAVALLLHRVGSRQHATSLHAASCNCFAGCLLQVIKETSALTFMIAGTVKEVVTVITAVIVFGDKFGLVNGIGLVIVIGGVLLFNWYKLRKLRQQMRQRIHSKDGSLDLDLSDDEVLAGSSNSKVVTVNGSCGSPSCDGVRRLVAGEGSGSRSMSPAELTGSNGLPHSFTKRKSGVQAVDDEQLSQEELQNLEFEPLLPLPSGVNVRR